MCVASRRKRATLPRRAACRCRPSVSPADLAPLWPATSATAYRARCPVACGSALGHSMDVYCLPSADAASRALLHPRLSYRRHAARCDSIPHGTELHSRLQQPTALPSGVQDALLRCDSVSPEEPRGAADALFARRAEDVFRAPIARTPSAILTIPHASSYHLRRTFAGQREQLRGADWRDAPSYTGFFLQRRDSGRPHSISHLPSKRWGLIHRKTTYCLSNRT